jgi:inositol-phosphate phosphatase/L-galactose 1-phosphate phosphatase/histidinol-phosphatase
MENEFIAFAHQLADAAGAIIRPYFEAGVAVEDKPDKTPVTAADREAEAAMRALIEQHYPDHAIFGEEGGQKKTISEYTWVLDPIDGTRAFIAGRREWGTLIALCADGVPILGILDQPATGERWLGVRGEPTTLNGKPIRTRASAALAEAELSTTSANYFTPEQAARVVKLAQSCRRVVADGDCYAYGLLARGERDIVLDAGLKPYDILALVPIIEGAGGVITGWDGAPVTLTHFATAVAVGDKKLLPSLTL